MKSTDKLTRENNVKALRLNNTDREIFENYMAYVRAELRVNSHDSEKMLNRILKRLLVAEDKGTHAMDFFDHDPKAHARKEIKALPNETFINICKYIIQHFILLLGLFCFLKGFIGFFIRTSRIYLYTFPITIVVGIVIIFLFIWMLFKTIQMQCFSKSHWSWILAYIIILCLMISLFYVIFIPQSFLAFGPYIRVGNWTFILISIALVPISLYIDHHFVNKDANTSL
ncbi:MULTISPECIES: DUF1129 family protein [Staphylococcus]|uniref:DUF1129 domain-containing protein n=2 Tax=Staphylococcus TaxID=1279 RepID=A0A2K4DWC4_9STAP|nr:MULTISPECIES: DUF1129 family protein [Staphylococcus]MBX8992874.1 DUF1129 family protein [Staphylococcus pettenkoferi]MCI2790916.1 DUF1129 family protein [Staphylococcus pettenkoferi]MCI2803172.1 DUF1129 family protein [Staphylococcus pettenkoferi]MCY1564197.1 DUF1129 family protein [Staphylococcus pettenkoferi]MCY1566914.1 DUF1129 family protein [Staphylococcus pettenkoferi]